MMTTVPILIPRPLRHKSLRRAIHKRPAGPMIWARAVLRHLLLTHDRTTSTRKAHAVHHLAHKHEGTDWHPVHPILRDTT
jgi:hypothetical protein